jgi:5-methylcytosine-specific restriction endonuclease McrA
VPTYLTVLFRERVYKRDGYRCRWCKREVREDVPHNHRQRATLDHLIPTSKGGKDMMENLVTACHACNNEKGDMMPDVFEWYLHMKALGHSRRELLHAIAEVEGAAVQ